MQNTSDDSVNATLSNSPSNKREPTTTTATTNDRDDTDDRSSNSQVATATVAVAPATTTTATTTKSTKLSSKTFFKKKDKSVPKRSNASNEVHGFISSFNQLTSNNLPVITSTMLKQKHVTSNKCERDNHGTTIVDSDDHSAEHNANKKSTVAQDDRGKYSECDIFPYFF